MNEFYVEITHNGERTIGRIHKMDGRWFEEHIDGFIPYGFTRKTYHSFLTPLDILTAIRKRYDDVQIFDYE